MIMDFNLNVRFDATPALVGAVSTLATAISGCTVMAPQVINALPGVVSISPLPEPAKVDAPAAESPDVPAPLPDVPTKEVVREAVAVQAKAGKKADVKALLDEFGVKSSPDLPETRRAEFLKRLNAL